jgi:hypothetical protein
MDHIATVHKEIAGCQIQHTPGFLVSGIHLYYCMEGSVATTVKKGFHLIASLSNNRDLQQGKIRQKTQNSDRSTVHI